MGGISVEGAKVPRKIPPDRADRGSSDLRSARNGISLDPDLKPRENADESGRVFGRLEIELKILYFNQMVTCYKLVEAATITLRCRTIA